MQILFAAKAGFDYNRTYVLGEGLKALGVEVKFYKIPERRSQYGHILAELSSKADAVYVPPFRHRDLSFVRNYARKPVVFDPLISRYLTKVVDYGHYWKAPQKWWIDYRDFRNCDLLLADTQAHLNYYQETLRLPQKLATAIVPVGVHTGEYRATPPTLSGDLNVGFYGTFVPLQGTRLIIEALAEMKGEKGFKISLLGTGYLYDESRVLARDLGLDAGIFKGWIAYADLAKEIAQFDLGLGVFGRSKKTDLVVPNKLYHYAASGKPIISKANAAVHEVFEAGKDIWTIDATPSALADKLIYARDHRTELQSLGSAARVKMESSFSHKAIAQRLLDALLRL